MNNLHAHIKFYNKMPELKRSQICYLSRQNLRWYIQNNTCNESAKKVTLIKRRKVVPIIVKATGKRRFVSERRGKGNHIYIYMVLNLK